MIDVNSAVEHEVSVSEVAWTSIDDQIKVVTQTGDMLQALLAEKYDFNSFVKNGLDSFKCQATESQAQSRINDFFSANMN